MLKLIADNAGTILVSLLLIALITGVVLQLRKDKKQGKSSCGGNCGCCPMGGACHKK